MKALGFLSVILGIASVSVAVGNHFPETSAYIPDLMTSDPHVLIYIAAALIMFGSVVLFIEKVYSKQSTLNANILHALRELHELDRKIDALQISAKHSVQDFSTDQKVAEYNGYEIFFKNGFFYIRDVNAKFFTREGAESWIDKTEWKRRNATSHQGRLQQ